ncbi:hypothetical protein WR25_02229 [Diploscapter pachys]|uniref:Uncharacterized protein n=1 Tax=Diploscapter pachys TaxID=2018661 RepID=A0A2A2K816_9BILA|nr:hypothetical protein WR25_02229 [Diploscapter pachys]
MTDPDTPEPTERPDGAVPDTSTRSSVSAKRTTSGVLSNLPRYFRPPVQAKIDAIGLVDVALPCWCWR